jgi:hypothetical protein
MVVGMRIKIVVAVGVMLVALSGARSEAQSAVLLPDTSQTTVFTANVSEQATVSVPAAVSFNVTNITNPTSASGSSVTVSSIVLGTATKQLKVSVQANATSFTPPVSGATTWAAGDVTWNAATWTNATGAGGTLSSSSYNTVADCVADASTCNTTGLVFTLAAKPTIKRAGNHTLTVTWKFESIGS